jgi:hypothetical protein
MRTGGCIIRIDIMNAPFPIHAKLIAAALSLSVSSIWCFFHEIARSSSGWIIFMIGCYIFGVFLAFWGVFRSPQLQLLWGWLSAPFAPLAIIFLLVGFIPGPEVLSVSVSAAAAVIGGYLLLLDADVKDYRRRIKTRQCA